MTCAAKRESQLCNGLSSAIRTLAFCSAEIRRVIHCRFTSLTAISKRPLAMWSPSGGPCGITSTPTHAWITASWSAFALGSLSHVKMILRKTKSLYEVLQVLLLDSPHARPTRNQGLTNLFTLRTHWPAVHYGNDESSNDHSALRATNHHKRQPTLRYQAPRYHDEILCHNMPWTVFLSQSLSAR